MASGFRFRALTPDQQLAVRTAHVGGATADQLARQYDVSRRTIHRAIERAGRERHVVRVAGHQASFEIEDGVPIQVTPWMPA